MCGSTPSGQSSFWGHVRSLCFLSILSVGAYAGIWIQKKVFCSYHPGAGHSGISPLSLARRYSLPLPSWDLILSLFAGKVTPDMQQQMDSRLSAVYSGKELEAARAQSGPMLEMVIRAIPFSLFLVSLFEAWAPMLLCRIIFRRLGIYDIPYFQPFREWQIPVAVIYIYIGVVGTVNWPFRDWALPLSCGIL